MQETKLSLESENIVQDNIEKLKQLFPEIITEDKIDFYKLKEVLGEEIDDNDEKYEFTWKGKHDAIRESQKTSHGTLRPCPEESKNWDTTKNLYIEGDNLEVLKLLQKSYQGKIKMMYIDPPYNTGNDFVYNDDYRDNLKNYLELDNNNSSNPETSGKYHTKWLNMLYPRLKLSKYLLSDDGVIFISIDDNEIFNLKKICDEIFGETNVDVMIWRKSGIGRDGKMKNTTTFRKDHEYIIVCFNKTIELNKSYEKPQWENKYPNPDNDPRGCYKAGSISRTEKASNPNHERYYTVTSPSGKCFTRQFDVTEEEFNKLNDDNRIYWGKQGDSVPSLKIFEEEKREVTTSSLIYKELGSYTIDDSNSTTTKGSKELESLLNVPNIGNEMRPKPVDLLEKLIQIGSNDNDIILDFFSGSGTTAEGVFNISNEKNEKRNFIVVQIPEKTNEKSKSFKAGYKNICEIGKERIRRAGDKLLDEYPDSDVDVGFKVLKLDSSNFKEWNPTNSPLEEYLEESVNNLKSDRSGLDLVYEIMIKYGIDLTAPIEEVKKNKYTFYSIGFGALIICLDDYVEEDVVEDIVSIIENNVELLGKNDSRKNRVVFKDNSFADDSVKTNIIQVLESKNIEDFITY